MPSSLQLPWAVFLCMFFGLSLLLSSLHPTLLRSILPKAPVRSFGIMGSIIGKVTEEQPKFEVVEKGDSYEVRKYAKCIVAEYQAGAEASRDEAFRTLAKYIGVFGTPENVKAGEKPEAIAMTAPVIMGPPESIAMTAPVIMEPKGSRVPFETMQFVLPGSKYTSVDEVPVPKDPRVKIREVPERLLGVRRFSGWLEEKNCAANAETLKQGLEAHGWRITGDRLTAGFNPPWTPPFLKTNEVMFPVEKAS